MVRRDLVGFLFLLLTARGQQGPDFHGVWRFRETTASSEYFLLLSESGTHLSLKTFSRNGTRYTLTEANFVVGREEKGTFQRMPAKFKASWDSGALVLDWAVEWPWGEQSEHHRWVLNEDGKSFHDDSTDTFKTRIRQHSSDFDRAPGDVAKLFEYPEQNSGEHFKNVQVLKDLPASAITPTMGTYQAALGVDCTHCHNQSAYDSDEKTIKQTARKMILMTAELNRREFRGRGAITCVTCHRGNLTPAR